MWRSYLGVFLGIVFGLSNSAYGDSSSAVKVVLPATVQIAFVDNTDGNIKPVGSGVLISPSGYVLTVRHNLNHGDHFFVRLYDGEVYATDYFVADSNKDLAVLHLNMSERGPVPYAVIGDSDFLREGQEIIALGFPSSSFITSPRATVSRGVVSGIDRVLRPKRGQAIRDGDGGWGLVLTGPPTFLTLPRLFQTDAMLNHGSSGGPVVDSHGRVVGLAHSIITNTGSNVGLNFAIPINDSRVLVGAVLSTIKEDLDDAVESQESAD